MAKQETKKLSENDKSLIGKYKTVFDNEVSVIASKDKFGNEFLEIANCVKDFQTPLFEKAEPVEIERQIKDNLITKI
jgi:predicted Mrr-cat superfamily restriction endonuclease